MPAERVGSKPADAWTNRQEVLHGGKLGTAPARLGQVRAGACGNGIRPCQSKERKIEMNEIVNMEEEDESETGKDVSMDDM